MFTNLFIGIITGLLIITIALQFIANAALQRHVGDLQDRLKDYFERVEYVMTHQQQRLFGELNDKVGILVQEIRGESSKIINDIMTVECRGQEYVQSQSENINNKLDALASEYQDGINHLLQQFSPLIEQTASKADVQAKYRDPVTGLLSMKAVRTNLAKKNNDLQMVDVDGEV